MSVRLLTIVVILSVMNVRAGAQILMTGNIETHVDSLIHAMPDGSAGEQDMYQPPSGLDLATWGNTIAKLMQVGYAAANDSASKIQYRIVQFTDNTSTPSKTYYILEKTAAGSHYWGVFLYNPAPKRGKLFIQSPHPLYDSNTGQQGIAIMKNNGARAWYVSGTHRCNSTTNTACDGTTDVCGGNYKISDQAHVANGPLQCATEIVSANITQLIIIQNHGFGKGTGDPDMIMGNGRATAPTGTDYLVQVRDNLSAIDPSLAFKVAHINTDWTTLTGATNTQGRFLNGSADPCSTPASSATGRFLHIEQALAGLRDNPTDRKKLSDAITATFAVDALTLASPNGGEIWTAGSSQNITWTAAGLVSSVKLEYTTDNGASWTMISAGTPNDCSYAWTVPNIGTWRAKVRIADSEDSSVGDMSSSVFRISYTVFPTTGTTAYVDPAAAFGSRKLIGVYDFHRGIDFPNALNTPIHPARAGIIVRKEDTTITQSSGLSRNGNWILIRIDSAGGQPQHNAYLHMNAFHRFNVGDTVSTLDTIGFMGKSGVGINTIHLHLELYKNLSGTSIDKDKAMNPLGILPYANANSYSVSFVTSNDSTAVQCSMPDTEIDFDAITIYGSLATRTVAFNTRTGIDPVDNDNPSYNNVLIDPDPFILDSSTQRIRFWTKTGEVGTIDSARISDVNGYSFTVMNGAGGTRYAVTSGNWNGAIWAATSGGTAGSASAPSSENNVVINSDITVTLNIPSAECNSISFGVATSKLSFSSGSVLSVYGDFTLASASHNAFSSWVGGAKLRFAGNNTQTIAGFGDFNTTNSSFKELQIDKSGGVLQTPGAASGNGISINIVDSLEITNGSFVLGSRDGIQGRNLTGSSATTPAIIVRSNGVFAMAGSASHIRSGNVSASSTPIGKLFVYGSATLATTSSNGVNFSNIDVYSGGVLTLESFSSSQPNNLKTGTVQVSSGATVTNNSTVDFWNASAVVTLASGAIYRIGGVTTVFSPTFNNSGKVQYARTTNDGSQTITDMNYPSLSIASSGSKSWSLGSSRTISDTLEILDGTLNLSSSGQLLSVQGVLRLQNDTIITGTNTLSLGTSTSIRGSLNYASGVIVGNFRRWFTNATTDSTLFPVGTVSKIRPAAVNFTSAPSTGGTVTASFTETAPGTTGLPLDDAGTSIVNVGADGYWTLTAGNGLTGGMHSLALSANALGGVSSYSTLRILKRSTGGPWILEGIHAVGAGSNAFPTARRAGMAGFSEFTIGGASDNTLPVEMAGFTGQARKLSILLEWITAVEIANSGFEIQRLSESELLSVWTTVGHVDGAGSSSVPHRYSFTDCVPAGGRYAYRLKQINNDGAVKYSSQIEVEAGLSSRELKLFPNYPNPFNPATTLEFVVPEDGGAVVAVYNAVGQLVAELFRENIRAGWIQQVRFDASSLPSGTYFVRLIAGGHTTMKKVLFLK